MPSGTGTKPVIIVSETVSIAMEYEGLGLSHWKIGVGYCGNVDNARAHVKINATRYGYCVRAATQSRSKAGKPTGVSSPPQ
jgi:hypothetical protein